MRLNIKPDQTKAKSLLEMAKITQQRLKETDKSKYPANTLIDYYDIIHGLLEALTSLEGVKIKGEGAHKELIDYVSQKYNLGELNRVFLQELKDYRNRISYEGFSINLSYINANNEKIKEIIKKLMDLINFD